MAGSINLSLSQQFDITNGKLLSGGKLYFFAAGTSTPQNAFKDQALTLAHPNPITLASDARVPQMYFADGSVKARLTNKAGVIQFESDNILVIGPSSGGGGGSSVDATTIFATGDVLWLDVSGSRAGWVRDNGRTIGSATSGASERANSDCQSLFLFLWGTYSDTICPVSTGRGLSAAADWAANKQIGLPDKRGFSPIGLTDMGNTDLANITTGAGVPFAIGSATAAGSKAGEIIHTLLAAEMPTHTHTATATVTNGTLAANSSINTSNTGPQSAPATATPIQISVTNATAGSGGSHNVTGQVVFGSFYRKL